MRKTTIHFLAVLISFLICLQLAAQDLTWTIKSKKAKESVDRGMFHFNNIEREMAYNDFREALKVEPQCTIAQIMMSILSVGETKKSYKEMAKKSVSNRSEAEKMLVDLLDQPQNPENSRKFWEEMCKKYPESQQCAFNRAITKEMGEDHFTAIKEFVDKYPNVPEGYNDLAYTYMMYKKDTAAAKTAFEKYITLYPDGCNPYDSMGEFYLNTGDLVNAKKYYTMALEKYPFFISSVQKIEEIKKKEQDKANASANK